MHSVSLVLEIDLVNTRSFSLTTLLNAAHDSYGGLEFCPRALRSAIYIRRGFSLRSKASVIPLVYRRI